jgi:hypothetical protein
MYRRLVRRVVDRTLRMPGAILGMRHQHEGHPGTLADCRLCGPFTFTPSRDPGIMVYEPGSPGVLVDSALVRRLLTP